MTQALKKAAETARDVEAAWRERHKENPLEISLEVAVYGICVSMRVLYLGGFHGASDPVVEYVPWSDIETDDYLLCHVIKRNTEELEKKV